MLDNYVDSSYLTSISLCHGIGGLDQGLERALVELRRASGREGWKNNHAIRCAAYVEIEAIAAFNLVAKMEQGVLAPAPVWSDLKTFPWEQFYNKIHIITGGYPCQPFSQAGLQGGTSDPRHLFPFIEQGIDAVRPVICFFENVANHLNIGYREVRERISSLGYKVEADIFAAQQVGAPHLRKRLFILAVADTYCSEQSKRRGDLAEMLGVSKQQSGSDNGTAIPGGDSEVMADTTTSGLQESRQRGVGEFSTEEREGMDDRPEQFSSTVVNTSGQSSQSTPEGGLDLEQNSLAESGWNEKSNRTTVSGPTLDYSIQSRLEGQRGNGNAKARWEESVRSIASSSLWPAGQGPNQYPWEEPSP